MTTPPPQVPPPAAPAEKKHLAHQLAQFSLYAPFVAIAIGCVGNVSNISSAPVSNAGGTISPALVLAVVNLLLLGSSVVAGIVALCFVPRLGGKGILGRSIVGVLISSVFLFFAASIVLMPSMATRVQKRITGDWYSTISAPGAGKAHVKMSLNSDTTARWEILDGPRPIGFAGHWKVTSPSKSSPDLTLQIQFDAPVASMPGVNGLGWHIESAQEMQLELSKSDAAGIVTREIYMRKP